MGALLLESMSIKSQFITSFLYNFLSILLPFYTILLPESHKHFLLVFKNFHFYHAFPMQFWYKRERLVIVVFKVNGVTFKNFLGTELPTPSFPLTPIPNFLSSNSNCHDNSVNKMSVHAPQWVSLRDGPV